jgi:AhpD family alkylhydroperoxidase
MRGASEWSVADRELMAALVSKVIRSPFCIAAHSTTAALAYGDESKVQAALDDLETAPIEEPLRATLRMLSKVAAGESLGSTDVRDVFAAGASRRQLEEALAVCFAFSVTARLANAFGFEVLSGDRLFAGARFLLKRGYR